MAENKEPLVMLARIGRPHGVRGGLSVHHAGEHLRHFAGKKILLCEMPAEALGIFHTTKTKGDFTLSRIEPAKGQPERVTFAEINDRDAATALTHAVIAAPLAAIKALAARERKGLTAALAELWYFELVELTVIDAESKTEIGKITHVEDLGLNTIITVEPASGQTLLTKPMEIPLDYPHWAEVDLASGRVALAEWRLLTEDPF